MPSKIIPKNNIFIKDIFFKNRIIIKDPNNIPTAIEDSNLAKVVKSSFKILVDLNLYIYQG